MVDRRILLFWLPTAPAQAQTGFSWKLECEIASSHAIYDGNMDPDTLEIDEFVVKTSERSFGFLYRNKKLTRSAGIVGKPIDYNSSLTMEIIKWDLHGGVLAKNPVQTDGSIEVWRLDLIAEQAWNVGISTLWAAAPAPTSMSANFFARDSTCWHELQVPRRQDLQELSMRLPENAEQVRPSSHKLSSRARLEVLRKTP